jgi:N-acetylglucosaminylphosphatidylinositol deacetylase
MISSFVSMSSSSMALYYIAYFVLGFSLFWFMTSTLFASSFPPPSTLRNKSVVLLIGHPDDEAMFFAPSVLALTSSQHGNHVRIICLSTGNAVGQGEIRRGELLNSARRLGIRRDEDVYIADDPRFQDGGENDWRPEDIANFLAQRFAEPSGLSPSNASATSASISVSKSKPTPTPPEAAPDVILTFDPHGISLHPNHCACHTGATHFLRHHFPPSTQKPNQQPPTPTPQPTLYTLTSISLSRKYLSILDAPLTALTIITTTILSNLQSSTSTRRRQRRRRTTEETKADRVIFVSGFMDYARAFGAMVHAHKTQMLWFRWGWILVGRYMVVNALRREEVVRAVS